MLGPGMGVGRGLGLGSEIGLGTGSDLGPGLGRNPLVQELSALETQIHLIKQQLQSAMRRKRELEFHQQTNPSSQQGTNQQTSTIPES